MGACSGGGDLLKVQPGHIVLVRGSCGMLVLLRASYTLIWLSLFTYNEVLFKLHLYQDDGEPEAGQSVQGS